MITALLLTTHLLVGVALLGAITHQAVGLLRPARTQSGHFLVRYAKVDRSIFTVSIAVLFTLSILLGGALYPNYRLNVRVPFEQHLRGLT
jgi:hypothetical protein